MQRKKLPPEIGDVFEALVDKRTFYVQYLGTVPTKTTPVIRVLSDQSLSPDSILFSELGFGINPPIRNGDFRLIQNAAPVNPPMGPFIEQKIRTTPSGIVTEQWICYENGERKELGRALPDRYLTAQMVMVHSWFTLKEAIESEQSETLVKDVML